MPVLTTQPHAPVEVVKTFPSTETATARMGGGLLNVTSVRLLALSHGRCRAAPKLEDCQRPTLLTHTSVVT